MNSSQAERFERAYRVVLSSFRSADAPDLSQHGSELLHHIPDRDGVPLTWLAKHMALPKSTASVLIKDLERRGFLRRTRDPNDERQLAIVLTPMGRRRLAADTVLDIERLAMALRGLGAADRAGLLRGLERLAKAGEATPWRPGAGSPRGR